MRVERAFCSARLFRFHGSRAVHVHRAAVHAHVLQIGIGIAIGFETGCRVHEAVRDDGCKGGGDPDPDGDSDGAAMAP